MSALKVAIWALQGIASSSSCPSSRMAADQALRAIGRSGEVPVMPSGRPKVVKIDRAELEGHALPKSGDSATA